MKTCPKCREVKDLSEFSKNKRKSDGHQSNCKLCMKERNALHYQNGYKDVQKQHNNKNRAFVKKRINEVRLQHPCPCGESCPACLDFHHLCDDKEATIATLLANNCWDSIRKELVKCCVICANCHRKHHAGIKLDFEMEPLVEDEL